MLEIAEVDVLDVLSSLSEDVLELEDEEDGDAELEAELDSDLAAVLVDNASVSETGIETEIEVGAPGLGPFVMSGTLLLTLSREGVAAAALTALDKSMSALSDSVFAADVAALEADSLTGLTTTAGSLSSLSSCRRLKDDLGIRRRCWATS